MTYVVHPAWINRELHDYFFYIESTKNEPYFALSLLRILKFFFALCWPKTSLVFTLIWSTILWLFTLNQPRTPRMFTSGNYLYSIQNSIVFVYLASTQNSIHSFFNLESTHKSMDYCHYSSQNPSGFYLYLTQNSIGFYLYLTQNSTGFYLYLTQNSTGFYLYLIQNSMDFYLESTQNSVGF